MDKRKIITIVVPLLIGGSIMLSLLKLTGPKPSSTASRESATAVVPQNSAHEKASLEEELRKKPGHTPILLRLAEIASAEGNAKGAIEYLNQAVASDAKNADARLELGRALYDSGDIEGGLRETQQLLADHPDNVDGLYNLGAIYANQNQPVLARQYWNRAVEVGPNTDSGRKSKDALTRLIP